MSVSMLEQLVRAQMSLDAEEQEDDESEFAEELEDDESELDLNSVQCHKDELVRAHDLQLAFMKRMFQPPGTPSFVYNISPVSEAATMPSVPLGGLRPIHIRHLRVGCRHTGRVLYGELCVEPLKMTAVQTILVDELGHAAKLSVYNALPHQHSVQKMATLFCKGLKVAIKEPFFKIDMDGSLIIRIDNPANFVRNPNIQREGFCSRRDTASSSSSSSAPLPSSTSPVQPRVLLDARGLREQGNRAFAAQDWKQAIQLYDDALKILLRYKDTASLSPSELSRSGVSKELVLGFSNRAEARLRMKHFEAAERDATKAIQLQKNHVKSCFRRGRALHGLHEYKEAALCFKETLLQLGNGESGMNIKEVRGALEASEICERQARTGKYDLLKMWREVEQGSEPLCGEYIGPVEIGPARERGLGMGLLVTRDVEPGELLIVSKAVAHAEVKRSSLMGSSHEEVDNACTGSKTPSSGSHFYHDNLAFQIVERARTSKRFQEQVNTLSSSDVRSEEKNIPDMDLFRLKRLSTELDDEIDVADKDSNTDGINMENIYMAIRRNTWELDMELGATLWLLPSFINHSCLPNACWMRVGKEALFVRAASHLKKGQEVLISYLSDPALPLLVRASVLKDDRGFECRCERCSFEMTMEPFLKPLTLRCASQPTDIIDAIEVVKSLEWAFDNVTAFEDERKKQWLRTSFVGSYTLFSMVFMQQPLSHVTDIHPLEAIVRAVQETLGGSEEVLALLTKVVGNLGECSPYVRGFVACMHVCLYGKQAPATLKKLVALRLPMIDKDLSNVGKMCRDHK